MFLTGIVQYDAGDFVEAGELKIIPQFNVESLKIGGSMTADEAAPGSLEEKRGW